jgi:hypothetical protein
LGEGGEVSSTFTPETSKLLSDVATFSRSPEETPESRLARLAVDPLAVFADLHLQRETAPQPPSCHLDARARVTAAITPAKPENSMNRSGPAGVLNRLRATAPAIAAHVYKDESAAPFEPSAADLREAIDAVQLDRYFPALAFAAGVATAFLLWLLI